jgi:ABC-2 type transport system permease protein
VAKNIEMRNKKLKLISKQVWASKIKNSSTLWLIGIFNVLMLFALFSGHKNLVNQQETVEHYSHEVRERWENRPDKHPHRMAHYGYVAFRNRFPLSFFDFGMDSYVGNAVFLEAHKQNTVNFSEASISNGLLRFGEISAGMILQLLLPLLIFFWGFDLVAREREQGTLRILLTQGVSWAELILGKSLGLFALALSIFIPSVIIGFILLFFNEFTSENPQSHLRFYFLIISYLAYFFILSVLAILVSAKAKSSKSALTSLIGFWLFFTLILPKVSQVVGQSLFPSPSKIEFDTKVEQKLIKQGDSHNPNDPHFKALKDSLLTTYKVDSTHKLPFNYSGYVMREGEKLSAETYKKHQAVLVEIYKKQQNVVRFTAFLNPYMAIKNLSMALSGTDYSAYNDFQNQAEDFRYKLAQTMNELQIKYIANKVKSSADKKAIISSKNWKDLPDFHHQFLNLGMILKNEIVSIISLILWIMVVLGIATNSRIEYFV